MPERVLTRRLSPLDASFLYIETPEAPLHLGGVQVFDGPLSRDRLVQRITERLDEIPRYRQRIVPAPLGLGHPFWEDAPDFDVGRHVLEVTLAPPGDEAQLKACAARLFETRLAREHPLWTLHLVHGLARGRTGVVLRIHHAMVDGISGVELLGVLFDSASTESAGPEPVKVKTPPPSTGVGRLLEVAWDAAVGMVDATVRAVQGAGRLVEGASSGLDHGLEVANALGRAAREPVARLPFNRALTGTRRLSWTDLPLDVARRIGAHERGTLNDVVLAVIADAVGRDLRRMGHATTQRRLRLMVPVNVRREDESGRLGNRVSMVPVEAPLEGPPLDRLRAVQACTASLKQARVADAVEDLVTLGGWLPAPLYATALSLAARPSVLNWSAWLRNVPPLTANVVCTNVPGPKAQLFAQGQPLVAHYPVVPLAFEFGLSFAVFSYNHRLFVGIIADAAAIDDLEPLTRSVGAAFDDLRTAAGVDLAPPTPAVPIQARSEGPTNGHA